MDDDQKPTASPSDESSDSAAVGELAASAPSEGPGAAPALPPPSQFASSLWGTNQWEESEWKPAASGLSAAMTEAPAGQPVEDGKPPPPRLTTEQYAVSAAQVIAGYTVLKPLGDASEGLFLARHGKLARVVSLKALTLPDVEDSRLMAAFVTRAKAAVRLQDPHLLEVHDFVEHADKWYAVTEPVFGESLRSRARHAALTLSAAVTVIEDVARALSVLRRARRFHGALTSRCIFLVEREQAVNHVEVLDFGAGARQDELVANSALAPEQKDGHEPDARGDVWGLGAVLFELLEGRPPSEARALSPVSRSGEPIPPLLAELVTRCLQADPRARFSSVESMAASLPHALGLAPKPMPSKSSYPALQMVVSPAPVASAPEPAAAEPAAAEPAGARPRRKGLWAALALIGVAMLGLLGAVGYWMVQEGGPAAVEAPGDLAPRVVAPPAAAPPEAHPVLLQSAANKVIGGAVGGAAAPAKVKPVVKKKPAKKKKR